MNQKIKDLIPFAVEISKTEQSKKVIDWFNKEFSAKYLGTYCYYHLFEYGLKPKFSDDKPSCRILTESEFIALIEEPDLPEKGEMIEFWDDRTECKEPARFYSYDSELKYPYLAITDDGAVVSFKHFARIPAKITITEAEIKRVFAEKMNVSPDLIEIAK